MSSSQYLKNMKPDLQMQFINQINYLPSSRRGGMKNGAFCCTEPGVNIGCNIGGGVGHSSNGHHEDKTNEE